jgi:hypothetical protein
MRRITLPLSILTTAILGVIAAGAQDQPPRASLVKSGFLGLGAEPGFCSKWPLLETPSVLKELKLTAAQTERLKQAKLEASRISERIGRGNRQLHQQLTKQGDRDGLAEFERAQRIRLYALTREHDRPLLAVLDSQQRTRLEQLQLQADGPMAFMRPDVHQRLKMSAEQVDIISAICERGHEATIQSATLPAGVKPVSRGLPVEKRTELLKSRDFAEQVDKVRSSVVMTRNATMREIAENLTKKQRATFERMLGEKFDFPKLMEKRNGETEPRKSEASNRDQAKDTAKP